MIKLKRLLLTIRLVNFVIIVKSNILKEKNDISTMNVVIWELHQKNSNFLKLKLKKLYHNHRVHSRIKNYLTIKCRILCYNFHRLVSLHYLASVRLNYILS